MSTLKTTYIQHPSAVGPAIELTAEGTVALPLSNLEDLNNVSATPTNGQVLAWNASTENWEPITMTVKEKKIAAFTGSGTWTVPAGVTYAIAHMVGGGGGIGQSVGAGAGGDSSVAFVSGTVVAKGGLAGAGAQTMNTVSAGQNNSGNGARGRRVGTQPDQTGDNSGQSGARIVAAAAVTPAGSITVTVGAGGAAGTSGAAGGSGYVYIEYYE